MNLIYESWPWYISGIAIALIMLLLQLSGKKFGMSSNLRTLCTMFGAGKQFHFFRFDWKAQLLYRWRYLHTKLPLLVSFEESHSNFKMQII